MLRREHEQDTNEQAARCGNRGPDGGRGFRRIGIGKDVQLNVKRVFSGSGFLLPCGDVFGVDYRNPATNAPGPGPVLFKVVCTRSGAAPTRI
jgi:hypothetical protein